MGDKVKDALERALRTFVQATAGAMLVTLGTDGAAWSDVPTAAVAGAFAGFIALLAMVAFPPRHGAG